MSDHLNICDKAKDAREAARVMKKVYLIVVRATDAVANARVFGTAEAAWAALKAKASWIASVEEIEVMFNVIDVDVEGLPGVSCEVCAAGIPSGYPKCPACGREG